MLRFSETELASLAQGECPRNWRAEDVIPALIDEVQASRKRIDALEDELQRMTDACMIDVPDDYHRPGIQ